MSEALRKHSPGGGDFRLLGLLTGMGILLPWSGVWEENGPTGKQAVHLRNSELSLMGPHFTDGKTEFSLNIPGASPCDRPRIALMGSHDSWCDMKSLLHSFSVPLQASQNPQCQSGDPQFSPSSISGHSNLLFPPDTLPLVQVRLGSGQGLTSRRRLP